ncbi:MAG: sporulation protein YqfD [Clostridiales bacterium]|nr:sporulation protein YqfD [Clostridiales bacterium]
MHRVIRWFRGYVRVQVKGRSPERFCNLCSNRGIIVWDFGIDENHQYHLCMYRSDFKKLLPVVKKSGTRPCIEKRIGFPFFLKCWSKRKVLVTGFLFFIAILLFLSRFIWNIDIEGNYTYTDEEMLKFLAKKGITTGCTIQSVNCAVMEEEIRKHYSDVGWVSMDINGTNLRVRIVETNMPVPYEKQTKPCHLVASHSGTVESIVTRSGVPLVKKGAVVTAGAIVISGIEELYGDFDVPAGKKGVAADGTVKIRTSYEYEAVIPLKINAKVYLDKETVQYGIKVFQKRFYLYPPLYRFQSETRYDIITSENVWSIGCFSLPCASINRRIRPYKTVADTLNVDEAKKKGEERLENYLDHLDQKIVSVLKTDIHYKKETDALILTADIAVIEQAGEIRYVTDSELLSDDQDHAAKEEEKTD